MAAPIFAFRMPPPREPDCNLCEKASCVCAKFRLNEFWCCIQLLFFRQKYQKACDHGINEKLEGTAYTADYALARGLGETEWFIPGALLSDSGLLGMFFFWFQLTVIQTWIGENGSIFSWFMQLNILKSPVFLDDNMIQEGVEWINGTLINIPLNLNVAFSYNFWRNVFDWNLWQQVYKLAPQQLKNIRILLK